MATQAQIQANRRNAQKSTGPKTPEGKAIVAQNATTHGLSPNPSLACQRAVIASENHDAFEQFRQDMLEEYNPMGPTEYILTERLITLMWKLRRSERMQTEAVDSLLTEIKKTVQTSRQKNRHNHQTSRSEQDSRDSDKLLGRIAVTDFADTKVIERLSLYERRIERSLFKTALELKKVRNGEMIRKWKKTER